jgi:hypothetical protein
MHILTFLPLAAADVIDETGKITLGAFPTVNLKDSLTWMLNGFSGIVTSNAPLIIGVAVSITALTGAIGLIKKFAKKSVKG